MDIAALMAEFARDTNTPLQFSPGGQLSLAFDQGVTIDLEHEPETDVLFVKTAVGTLPTDIVARHLLLIRLLVANGFDPVTQSAAIACEADEKTVILIAKLAVRHTTVVELIDCIKAMIDRSGIVSSAIDGAHGATPSLRKPVPVESQVEHMHSSLIISAA